MIATEWSEERQLDLYLEMFGQDYFIKNFIPVKDFQPGGKFHWLVEKEYLKIFTLAGTDEWHGVFKTPELFQRMKLLGAPAHLINKGIEPTQENVTACLVAERLGLSYG